MTSRSEIPRTLTVRCAAVCFFLTACALLAGASRASANLDVLYSEVGTLQVSVDATGTNESSSIVQVEKPAGATVKKAFLFGASTGETGYNPPDGEVTLDGVPLDWDSSHTLPSSIFSENVLADVTDMVKAKVDPAPAGLVDFTVTEANTYAMDGEILAVVFNAPTARVGTVVFLYGAQETDGDHFALGLTEPIKPSASVSMSLGISYGYQPSGQYSEIEVNGESITSSSGGQDDCATKHSETPDYVSCGNGELITAGGIGDDTDNPPDPFAIDAFCFGALGLAPRCDDELYDLRPLVLDGSTSIDVDTSNPSDNDNILFASFVLGAGSAVVGEGVVLTPAEARSQVGTLQFFRALVQDEEGNPEPNRTVTLKALSGPSAGMTLTRATDSSGRASFNYAASQTGTDTLVATYTDGDGDKHTSNSITKIWAPRVDGTFGGEWPAGDPVTLRYSYGGDHRYLGNVVQGATNWNNAGTKVHIVPWSGGTAGVQIPFIDVYERDTWWGATVFAEGDCDTCGYTRNTIFMNQRELDGESDAQRTKVATHEFGHALGLEHPYDHVNSSVPSVMWQGLLGGSTTQTPQAYDINRIKGMHP